MNETDAARIGRIHEDRIEWPAANILGRPYNRDDTPPRHTIGGGLFVVGVNTLAKAEVVAELALLKAAVSAEAKGSARGTAKSSEVS